MSSRIVLPLLLLSASLPAQRPDTATIPMELARALASMGEFGGARGPEIVVGRVAEPGLAALVPRGARVLGGVIYPSRRNSRSTTFASMAERPDSALVLLGKAFEAAGYKAAPTFESMRGERGGFASSSSIVAFGPGMGSFISYCSDSSSLSASVAEGDNRGSLLRITSAPLRNSMCDPEMRSRMQMGGRMEELELPTLRPPAGATGGSTGSSGSDDSRETRAQLGSSLSAAQMLDHFAPQLTEQGWTLVNRATDGDVSVQTARRTDKNGEPLYLSLVDTRYTSRDHEVTLRVWRQSRYR